VREGVEAKLCAGPDGQETFVLCRSVERRDKEQAMHARFAQRIEQGLDKLGRRLEHARRALDRGKLERQIGRLLERNARSAGRYLIDLVEDPSRPAGVRLKWSARPEWDDWARHSEGCYLLRTNITDWDAEQLWRTYIQLSEAEAAFRIHKSELAIRPIWHQREDRVQAHNPGMLSGLRLVEDAGAVAKSRRTGQQPAHHSRGTGTHPERRRGAATGRGAEPQAAHSLRGQTRQGPSAIAQEGRRLLKYRRCV
jgi:hypothetical protein